MQIKQHAQYAHLLEPFVDGDEPGAPPWPPSNTGRPHCDTIFHLLDQVLSLLRQAEQLDTPHPAGLDYETLYQRHDSLYELIDATVGV